VFPPVSVKGRREPVTIYSVRVAKTPRGVVAAIPGELRVAAGALTAVLVRVGKTKDDKRKVTVHIAGQASMGETAEFQTVLPENPVPLTLRGRVVSGSPLIDCKRGRSVEIEVEAAHPELARLLAADGAVPAGSPLDGIKR
jgi:hypothetical protein